MKAALENLKINVKLKLAALWSSLMFLYIYADWFSLMTPGAIEDFINLKTPIGSVTPSLLIIFSALLIVPSLMIFLSVFLTAKVNKWLNICVGTLWSIMSILIIIADIGKIWQTYFVIYNIVELFVLAIIVWTAWKWPKQK